MGMNYDDCFNALISFISDQSIDNTIRNAIIRDCSKALHDCAMHSEKSAEQIFGILVTQIDILLSDFLRKNSLTRSEYENASRLCRKQREYLDLFQKYNWISPDIKYRDLDDCNKRLTSLVNLSDFFDSVKDHDRRISELFKDAERTYTISACNTLESELSIFNEEVVKCNQNNLPTSKLKNANTYVTNKKLKSIRDKAEEIERLRQSVLDNDFKLQEKVASRSESPAQWDEIIELCTTQSNLIQQFRCKNWVIPLLHSDPDQLKKKFEHYRKMAELDSKISAAHSSLREESPESESAYTDFYSNCNQQQENFNLIKKESWMIPAVIKNRDPLNLMQSIKKEQERREQEKARLEQEEARRKREEEENSKKQQLTNRIIVGIVVLVVAGIVGLALHFHSTSKIPFNSTDVQSKTIGEIIVELNDAGFTSIEKRPQSSGWDREEKIISVQFDDKEEAYEAGERKSKSSKITINYSSENREKITADMLSGWKDKTSESIQAILNSKGFNNITINKDIITNDKKEDTLVTGISLNRKDYTEGSCWIPKNAPIIITCKTFKVKLNQSMDSFKEKNLDEVKTELEKLGFTPNIKTEPVTTGIKKENTVLSVSISDEAGENGYDPDSEITIKVSGGNRIDVTEILKDGKGTDATQLQKQLKELGFTRVEIDKDPEVIFDKQQKFCVTKITLNDEEYDKGECWIPKHAPIILTHKTFMIRLSQSMDSFKGKNLDDVKQELVNLGFNLNVNVKLEPVSSGLEKGNTVLDVQIQKSEDLDEENVFDPDAEITIKYSIGNRFDATEIMKNWKETDASQLRKQLQDHGLSVTMETESVNIIKQGEKDIAKILINGEQYESGECFIPLDAVVTIEKRTIQMEKDAKEYEGMDYDVVKARLETKGFKNIEKKKVKSLLKKKGTIESISISGEKNFTSSESFPLNSKIIISVYS